MKITTEHYNELVSILHHAFDRVREHWQTTDNNAAIFEQYKNTLLNDPRVKNMDMRVRWDFFYAAGTKGHKWAKQIYKYADDSHIDTALKRAIKQVTVKVKT